MCSGLPALPDSQEPWTAPPPSGLVTALLTVGMGGSPALLRGSHSISAHCRRLSRVTRDSSQARGEGRG